MQTVEQPRVTGEVRVEVDGRGSTQCSAVNRGSCDGGGGGGTSAAASAARHCRHPAHHGGLSFWHAAGARHASSRVQASSVRDAMWGSSSAGSRGAGSPTDQSIVLMQANWRRAALDLEPPRPALHRCCFARGRAQHPGLVSTDAPWDLGVELLIPLNPFCSVGRNFWRVARPPTTAPLARGPRKPCSVPPRRCCGLQADRRAARHPPRRPPPPAYGRPPGAGPVLRHMQQP